MHSFSCKYKKIVAGLIGCMLITTGCSNVSLENQLSKWIPMDSYEKETDNSLLSIKDIDSLYDEPIQDEVLYLTVGRNYTSDSDEATWSEMNARDLSWFEESGEKQYECDALVQFGNEDGPTPGSFGYGNRSSNATIRLTGMKASKRQQKSYRIKINSGSASGIKTLVLSKAFTDPFRFTNKLCFDLMTEIDELLSVRTRFVHLYVKDETADKDNLFVDYGLYTMTETVNKKYLSNRNLDNAGELYKVEDFDFGRHEDVIMQPTNADYNEAEFEKLLEAKGSNDYSKLIKLLDAVNDESVPINEIVDNFFYKDNFYSWMAFNILMDNKDTDTENYYLYSPTGTDKFYIIAWDNDSALRSDYEVLKDPGYQEGWEKGIYLYSDSKLFGRVIRSQHCINELSEYVTKLHESSLSPENVRDKTLELKEQVKPYLYSLPDRSFARVTEDDYDKLIDQLPEQMNTNFYKYYDSLDTPWPFHILEPEMTDGNVQISWEESYLLNGSITYSVEVADSWDFAKTIQAKEGLTETVFDAGKLKPGQYFVRVQAVSDAGITQEAYEFYNTEKKTTVNGVLCFYVLDDGSVIQSTF